MKKDDRLLITSTQNPRIKTLRSLQKRRAREQAGMILIEGVREVDRALASGISPVEVFICRAIMDNAAIDALADQSASLGASLFEVNSHVYDKIAYRGSSEGIMAVAPRPVSSLDSLVKDGPANMALHPLLLIADGIEKPGNLGAIIRSADGAGVTGIILSGSGVDVYSPNVIRASTGTVFRMNISTTEAGDAIAWLRKNGIDIVTSTPAAELLYHEADYRKPCAIVLGSEDKGAGAQWLDSASIKVRIPMNGLADSLNVSVSASIIAYEAVRQRSRAGGGR